MQPLRCEVFGLVEIDALEGCFQIKAEARDRLRTAAPQRQLMSVVVLRDLGPRTPGPLRPDELDSTGCGRPGGSPNDSAGYCNGR
jgi:hypothetical protein